VSATTAALFENRVQANPESLDFGGFFDSLKKPLNEFPTGGVSLGMKKNLLIIAGTAVIAFGVSSCGYGPLYDGGGPTRSSVAVGYGYGHGYGGSSFSTSFFWSTGDPRWGYDPYARSYYDFNRRAYYDPYLYGYYPVGYRPPILVGVPHPVGYRQGWCPPPRRVTNVTVVNYRNRESAYRNTRHSWARNVRYDSRHRATTTSPRSRDQIRRNDGNRTRQNSTNWTDRNTRTRESTFASAPATGSRNQWDGRSGNVRRQPSPATTWQGRNTSPPRQSANAPRSQAPQQFDRGNQGGNRVQDVRSSGQRGNGNSVNRENRQALQPAGRPTRRGGGGFGGHRPPPPPPQAATPSSDSDRGWQRGNNTTNRSSSMRGASRDGGSTRGSRR